MRSYQMTRKIGNIFSVIFLCKFMFWLIQIKILDAISVYIKQKFIGLIVTIIEV